MTASTRCASCLAPPASSSGRNREKKSACALKICARAVRCHRLSGVEWSGVERSGVEWSGVEWSGRRCHSAARLREHLAEQRGRNIWQRCFEPSLLSVRIGRGARSRGLEGHGRRHGARTAARPALPGPGQTRNRIGYRTCLVPQQKPHLIRERTRSLYQRSIRRVIKSVARPRLTPNTKCNETSCR